MNAHGSSFSDLISSNGVAIIYLQRSSLHKVVFQTIVLFSEHIFGFVFDVIERLRIKITFTNLQY